MILSNLRDCHPEMFTTRLGKNMPPKTKRRANGDYGYSHAMLSHKQVETVRSLILLHRV